MLDDDAFQWFEDHGGMTRANGDRFRQMVLSRGNTEDLQKMYDGVAGRRAEHRADAEEPRAEREGEVSGAKCGRGRPHDSRAGARRYKSNGSAGHYNS